MTPGSDQVNRLRKAKRLTVAFMLRNPTWHHIHPTRKRDPNPYEMTEDDLNSLG